MALQFRRGAEADLPSPTDASIGEPLFTTDSGKLFVKKADGTYAEISGSGSANLDLSGIAAGAMVKVNSAQDGFVGAAGGDVPSHTHAITNVTGLQDALAAKVDLADMPQNPDGTLNLAQESTLTGFIDDFPVDANGDLDIAQESTLLELGTRITALENAPDGVDLSSLTSGDVVKVSTVNGVKVLASATVEQNTIEGLVSLFFNNTGTEEGYLKFVPSDIPGLAGNVFFAPAIFSAPEFIDGGGADADNPT